MTMSTFNRIVGYTEEKDELQKICKLIRKKDDLYKAGGKLPKGLFLIGPNGVGKTVLAKAFIEESKCNVVMVDYNDVDNDTNLVSYIKGKFKEASKKVPCILFIDELDKLIGNNQELFMPENMENSRVLLGEINRYSNIEGLFLLAVANKEYALEKSITRSGRIDRIIEIDLPNQNEREEIIKYYSQGKLFEDNVAISELAKVTRGMSGADIESILNNALIKSFSEDRSVITIDDVMTSYYDKIFNNSVKESNLDKEAFRLVAYHEAGHAIVTYLLNPDSLTEVTILGRGNIRGFLNRHENEASTKTLQQKENIASIALAGLITEEVFFDKRADGSGSDIIKAKNIVSELVRMDGYYGLDKVCAPNTMDNPFLTSRQCSNDKLVIIEKAEDELIETIYNKTKQMIISHKHLVEKLGNELLIKKVLSKGEIVSLLEDDPLEE